MFRSRPLTYFIGALLAIFTLYIIFPNTRIRSTYSEQPSTPDAPPSDPPDPPHADESQTRLEEPAIDLEEEQKIEHPQFDVPPKPEHAPSPFSIDELIRAADYNFKETLSHQTYTLRDAAAAYRKRRGRHPPPGFDLWYQYATKNDAIMVEEYWDQIYHDLNPFWAISPQMLRAQARSHDMAVEIKDGKATPNTGWFWHEIWSKMFNEISAFLPDMFIACNSMDESRIFTKWETINEYMRESESKKQLLDPHQVISKVQGWSADKEADAPELPDLRWNGHNVYKYGRSACPPTSPARQVGGILHTERVSGDFHKNRSDERALQYFDGRFVTNYTEASDFCYDATTGGLHGALMQPFSVSSTDVLWPLFGGSKFHVNNEILLPAPMYWNDEERFGGTGEGDQVPWNQKTPTVIWRGTATGGRSKPFTWHLFHRHRFVAITNGTRYRLADKQSDSIFSAFFRAGAINNLHKDTQGKLANWLDAVHDVSFTNLVCDETEDGGGCWYTNDEYEMKAGIEFPEHYKHRYVPDIDGNSFSGRYRAFLLSNSLPLKSTIYREWHDSRLIAWKHFIPMNNRFSDYYKLLEYFIGNEAAGLAGHDEQARAIATDGRVWAEKVLRKVDMQIYVGRLLLEYARLTDDNRDVLGWVYDLLSNPSV